MPKGTDVDKGDIKSVLKQRPNRRFLGFRLRLRVYNAVDSTKTERDKEQKYERYIQKNKKRILRQDKINEKRIQKALKRGKTTYKPKKIDLKDTLDPSPTFRERLKYVYGEAPVIYDSSLTRISKEQIQLFMQKNGYFHAEVDTEPSLNLKRKRAKVTYRITPKLVYFVDTFYLRTDNKVLEKEYNKFIKESKDALIPPFRFDSDKLSALRKSLARHMRNNGIFGFRENYISFEVDTLNRSTHIKVAIDISKRLVGEGDIEKEKPFNYTKINQVNFHLQDTISYKGNFKKEQLDTRNIKLKSYDEIPTFDTLQYDWYRGRNKKAHRSTFLYNGRPTTRPELIEFQNYLEETNLYKDYLVDYSYSRMLNLGVFKSVKINIQENNDNSLDVDYYLTPQKPNIFSFEPKGTHSNSFLGLSSSLSYINRNLFRRGQQLKISVSGGFESQPEVFGKNDNGTVLKDGTRSFNTFEVVPSFELTVPGLVPIGLTTLSKSQNARTVFSAAYGYQKRPDFYRQTVQWKYQWYFQDIYQTQYFKIGIPVIGGIQFVNINKTEEFKKKLEAQNDVFLLNAYSNQAIYKDLSIEYSFTNPRLKDGKIVFSYGFDFDMAGMIMSAITQKKAPNAEGFKEFLGQRYSQFIRLDNEFKLHHDFSKIHSLHYKLQLGAGIPLKNNGINLPFDYSFFAGGSVDNRGFRARSLGPGVYKYYLDSIRTSTQMGDMRLSGSFEYRFKMSKLFEGAFFVDAGNVWTMNNDPNRPGGQISKDFYKQLSVSTGLGLRVNFTYLILRLDMGIPMRNPALPEGARWIFQSRTKFTEEAIAKWGIDPKTGSYPKDRVPNPFKPQFHIAIGYPF
ncbi:MAG: BamA/TamA family outer membrane protein [Brumimicrobium sp.]|nr:BamA/TamA family outer membrane protein [Brumimicrobium sp.]MCO5268820.1 outer membrane protein assembly factor [Brumimicrobium sp.]